MDFDKAFEHLCTIDGRIKMKQTGTPREIAKELGISRATLFRRIEKLKKAGHNIRYSRKLKSFTYWKNPNILYDPAYKFQHVKHVLANFQTTKNEKLTASGVPSRFLRRKPKILEKHNCEIC